ncbi:uncharacterized protein LOC133197475 [Saccostrea echinata]|uniref:uncharacterized protein LOC133197475 n=1 Tax=Saccostrea echinata TaxID=191078 RepID=UPI002A80DECD|nr:uncharacterized protein LOC133197475 [Saccostrea echinata]
MKVDKDLLLDVQEIENAAQKDTMSAITIAYIITVPGIIIICIGVNVVTYRCGVKKGRRIERKHNLHGFQEETQAVHYQHYHNDDENPEARPLAQQGPSAGQVSIDPTHDYAAYDEIKDQRQRMQESQRRKEGGYLTPVSQDQSRALPPVRTNGDGYISPKAAAKKSLEESRKTSKSDSPSPPGNGGYISPLQQEKNTSEKMGSGNSDSSSEKSDKSDKSRKYQNEPSSKSSPKTKALYESLKDTGVTQEHQYIELQT